MEKNRADVVICGANYVLSSEKGGAYWTFNGYSIA